ncbi:MAG: UDP-N-acetylmuramoyl-tripeptide--D-alanyl-D-alanine ligase [Clostridiales bacterium]|nr:UDP-N-acetylmuramoyl-tripeptide--D-alanyl-D-alanine ligase [Candidatus Crickella caballi]
MRKINLEYIVEGTGGKLYAKAADGAYDCVSSVEIDNRRIKDECLFFCIIGARVDAHTLLPDVREKGCHNVVVSNEEWAEKIAAYGDMNVILVEDTIIAMDNLATKYMDEWTDLKRVAITGSAGKTTTKEFTYSVLSSKYKTGKNIGNYNSETGIPLTVFNSYADDIEIAITEIGIGDGRDMSDLVEMVKPDNAIVTNVGSVHMEFFESSREKLLEAKLRITEQFGPESTLVVNNQVSNLSVESVKAHSKGNFKIVTVGDAEDCDFRITDIEDKGIDGVSGKLIHNGISYDMQIPIIGAHNLFNAAEAVAIGEIYGISIEDALEAVKNIDIVENRLDVMRGRYTIINDTYNANPEALKAAVEVIRHTPAPRKGLIIGDMRELGKDEVEIHQDVGEYISTSGVDFVVTLGRLGRVIAETLKEKGGVEIVHSFDTIDEVMANLDDILRDGDLFLVKASNALGITRIIKEIKN